MLGEFNRTREFQSAVTIVESFQLQSYTRTPDLQVDRVDGVLMSSTEIAIPFVSVAENLRLS